MNFYIAATIIFGVFALIWKRDTVLNLFLKVVLSGMFCWGVVLTLTSLGYMIKR